MSVPEGTITLVLNDDYTPLNSVHWKKGIKKVFSEHECEHCYGKGHSAGVPCSFCGARGIIPPARVIEYYDIWIRDSKGREYPVPAVICNSHHVKTNFKKANFSRANIFKRDGHRCQYCGKWCITKNLTLDHVVPRSMWEGNDTPTNWHNIVTACYPCNAKKGNRTPEQANMRLRKKVNGKVVYYSRPKQANNIELTLGLTSGKVVPEWEPYVKQIMSDRKLDKAV